MNANEATNISCYRSTTVLVSDPLTMVPNIPRTGKSDMSELHLNRRPLVA